MTTKLACLQDFALRDSKPNTRQWVIDFSVQKYVKGNLEKPWDGTINKNHPNAIARVDYGRWLAECPFCGLACMVDPDDDFFYCLYCSMSGSGQAGRVTFPADRDAIEDVILDIPVIVMGKHPSKADEALKSIPAIGLARNWSPGESVEDIQLKHASYITKFATEKVSLDEPPSEEIK